MLLVAMLLVAAAAPSPPRFNDFHYPDEEPREMATVVPPVTCANTSGWAVVFDPADGSVAGAHSLPCVLERSFTQWGLIALLDTAGSGKARLLRKSVGSLNGIVQPRFQFPPAFFNTVYSARRDVVSEASLCVPPPPPPLRLSIYHHRFSHHFDGEKPSSS